jgi:hypothetical protein
MQFLDAERAFPVGIEFVEQIGGGLLGFVEIDGAIIIRIELADRSRLLFSLCECCGSILRSNPGWSRRKRGVARS